MKMRFASRLGLIFVVLSLVSPVVPAQIATTGRLTGNVKDAEGALLSNAQVVARHNLTNAELRATTNDEGGWSIPAVQSGVYTVTLTAQGFKSTVIQNVKVDAGTTATVNAALEVGGASEQVVVTSGGSVIQTESANVSSTIVGRQIGELPFTTRDAMQLVLTLPGVQTPGTPRTSSVNGLNKSSINITLDGANIQDNYLKSSDGFFTTTQVRSDAIEEVTVSTATPGAESAAGGAFQIKFVTKSGSNNLHGGVFWQHRNNALNANYYFNNIDGLPRDVIKLNQAGGRIGGPIVLPKIFNGSDKAFFFVNFEEFRLPQTYNADRTVLTDSARQGIFTYSDTVSGATRTVNLYQLAAARGFPSTLDPRIGNALNLVAGAQGRGILKSRIQTASDYNRLDLTFQDPGRNLRRFPTTRLDFNINKSHSLEFVHNYQHYFSLPDGVNGILSIYPGEGTVLGSSAPVGGSIYRNSFTFVMAERWTISPSLVNEIRLTSSGNGTSMFRREFDPRNYSLFNQLNVGNPFSSGFFTYTSQSRRNTPVKTMDDQLNWQKGSHRYSFGFSFTRIKSFVQGVGSQNLPSVALGLDGNDPVRLGSTNIFSTTNFPNSNTTQRGDAMNLYALLVGRVSGTGRTAVLDEDSLNFAFVPSTARNHATEYGVYVQDSWKAKPNLTLTGGIRWQYMPSPVNDNGIYTRTGVDGIFGVSGRGNLFKPGVFRGGVTQFTLVEKGEAAFDPSKRDFAPSVGFAWTPQMNNGFLRRVLGETGQTVLRGGYSIAYIREGFNAFDSMFGSNDGPTIALGTGPTNDPTIFGAAGSRMLRDLNFNNVPLRSMPEAKFPITARQSASINDFNPNLRSGYVQSWTFGIQREIGKDMALEVRYVGNHGTRMWRQYEIGEVNIFENGFLNEFLIAQENLRISRAANSASTNFGNAGLPGQKDIPIIRTALGLISDLTFATTIARGEAGRLAANIAQNVTRMNRLTSANLIPSITLPDPNAPGEFMTLSNFFVANPRSPTSSWIMDNAADANYHSMQIDFRRRMSKGVLIQGGYVWSHALTNFYVDSSAAAGTPTTLRDFGYDKGPAPRDLRHAIKFDWIHELPIGPGQRFLNWNLPVVSKLLEGWQWSGVMRIQSGTPSTLTSGRLTFNNRESGVELHNITTKELQKLIKIRKETVCGSDGKCLGVIYFLPQNLIENSQAAFEAGGKTLADLKANEPYIGPPTTPGRLGNRIFMYGPWTSRWDLNLLKRTTITENTNFEFRVQFLNAFNQSIITMRGAGTDASGGFSPSASTFGQTRNAYRDFTVSGTNDPGGRLIEFQLRLNF